jgi:hypothetical protein
MFAILLKETAKQISPALTLLFQASINQGKVPEEWKSANITPLFKKGDRSAKAMEKSRRIQSICSPTSRLLARSSMESISWVSVDRRFLKPCWESANNPFVHVFELDAHNV